MKKIQREIKMSKMLCSISDDPYNDYSDYIEGKGVYSKQTELFDLPVENEANLFLTETMLNKSIIDVNKSVLSLLEHIGLDYDDIEVGERHSFPAIFYDGTPSQINFYKTKRGDKRMSIKHLKAQAEGGMVLRMTYNFYKTEEYLTLEVI
jgi:hypothetical protein